MSNNTYLTLYTLVGVGKDPTEKWKGPNEYPTENEEFARVNQLNTNTQSN